MIFTQKSKGLHSGEAGKGQIQIRQSTQANKSVSRQGTEIQRNGQGQGKNKNSKQTSHEERAGELDTRYKDEVARSDGSTKNTKAGSKVTEHTHT